MNFSLQFSKVQKTQNKRAAAIKNTVNSYAAVVSFHDSLWKRQAKPYALRIFWKPATVKPFENMVYILWVYAAAIILYDDLSNGR